MIQVLELKMAQCLKICLYSWEPPNQVPRLSLILGWLMLWVHLVLAMAKTHHRDFVIEERPYTRLCVTKSILTVNGQFPGPTISAYKGDSVIVRIHNRGDYNITDQEMEMSSLCSSNEFLYTTSSEDKSPSSTGEAAISTINGQMVGCLEIEDNSDIEKGTHQEPICAPINKTAVTRLFEICAACNWNTPEFVLAKWMVPSIREDVIFTINGEARHSCHTIPARDVDDIFFFQASGIIPSRGDQEFAHRKLFMCNFAPEINM